ncbi:MAG: poly-gamma-glutamate synthase PgsB [Ignavibacteriaceae bacterium]|jgi:poly-gamma-glutamate synthase PgsB/CapB|nr:poly-gamma-glutamate synthase PgsB [Ignavibacteriaceae bacterium]MCW8816762.1 poly-gamma-glutamate synthase PgsB [Ignavibacteriaceae bacterium]MCW9096433.1 poly-gamma-glutamate synthase PgsB [Ignavibacteriaceae bacterium]
MYVFTVLLILFLIVSVYGIVEFALHQKRILSIPIRIHVNGTRGKSSVTRLIGAALREGGIKTITKVTGTYPRLVLEDGCEVDIYRKTDPNIIEQLSIIKLAAQRKAKAIVMECMAIQPQYQWITETKMMHSTIGLITNVRLDHVEVMGYTLPEIANVLGKTIPRNQHFFTTENQTLNQLEKISKKQNTVLHLANSDSVTDDEMNSFNYLEHKENVALALSVCEHLGIERNIALRGMYKAIPDAGVLKLSKVNVFGKSIKFYNAFAANDPQSTLMIWQQIKDEIGLKEFKIILLNSRKDRLDRARQLTGMVGKQFNDEYDYLILVGESSEVVENLATSNGVKRNKILNLGWTEPEAVFEAILACTEKESTVLAIGNMGAMGADVAEYFENRSHV